jgi:hypothetical protein
MSFASLTNQTITHYPRTAYNTYGEQTDSASGVDYKARVELKTMRRLQVNGEVKIIDGKVFILDDPGILIDERVDYNSVKYRVHSVKQNVDGQGNVHHVTLEIKKWVD